jgi:thymidylate synthase (methanogen type)
MKLCLPAAAATQRTDPNRYMAIRRPLVTVAETMHFEAIHFADRLRIINPEGDVGVVTLWSPVSQVLRYLQRIDETLLVPTRSRIAVIANLYGDGLAGMMCNLLWNPQIRWILALGQDLTRSGEDLVSIIEDGVLRDEVLGRPVWRIPATGNLLDGRVDPSILLSRLRVVKLGKLSEQTTASGVRQFFSEVGRSAAPSDPGSRMWIDLEQPAITEFPSDPIDHTVRRRKPLDCWEELVFRVLRFGRRTRLQKGPRLELLNVKTIIMEPGEESAQHLAKYGFSLSAFQRYQANILEARKPEGISYTYGNRLRGYFGGRGHPLDLLDRVVEQLRNDPQSRRSYATTWDNSIDSAVPDDDLTDRESGDEDAAAPCLTTIFYRQLDNRLTLTATFRSHNLMRAWLENAYGLMALQNYVCERVGMAAGPITVISHSLTIDPTNPTRLEIAKGIEAGRSTDDEIDRASGKHALRMDPMGYFEVTIDDEAREIVAEHKYQRLIIREYRARTSEELLGQIARDCAVSVASHALWLGREVGRAEAQLHAASRQRADL